MLDELIAQDKGFFLYLNNLGTTTFDGFWMFLTHKLSAIPMYAILLYFIIKQVGWKATLVFAVFVALLVTCTDQLATFFKEGFERWRPCYDEEIRDRVRLVKDGCGGKFGYFSAHAASTMGVAILLGNMLKPTYKYLKTLLIIWALLVGYSRIYIGVHFPLDVLTGYVIGAFFGFVFFRLFQKVYQKKFLISSE